jgi:hypothetical protein
MQTIFLEIAIESGEKSAILEKFFMVPSELPSRQNGTRKRPSENRSIML